MKEGKIKYPKLLANAYVISLKLKHEDTFGVNI
jgi:hypothetical protein